MPPHTRRLSAALLTILPLLGAAGAAEAQSRSRGRGASLLRQAPPEDPDEPSDSLAPPTGTFGSALSVERRGRTADGPAHAAVTNTSILGVRLGLPEGFAINGVLHLEPVEDPASRATLPGHAAWVETLNLRWQVNRPLLLFGGKIHPRFGAAWFRVPGLYGADFAGDYELREKIGVGAELDLDELLGTPAALGGYELRVEAFGADTSALSGGLFRPRWAVSDPVPGDPVSGEADRRATFRRRNSRALGGPDNAPGLPGVTVSLSATGIDLPGGAAVGYSLAASLREPGEDATRLGRGRRERGATAAVFGDFEIPFGLRLMPLVEVAAQEAAGGFAGSRSAWLTAAVALRRDPVTLTLVAMRRRARDVATGPHDARERAANIALDLGKLTGIPLLAPVALTFDWRRLTDGGRPVTDVAGGLLVSLGF